MNNGLPSLLDAIFGKKDLALISLDEIYEVIREFPSFNAGHFLLAKKLKLQDDRAFEKESMRTALYFNNPFWLQSLLDDGNHLQPAESFSTVKKIKDEDEFIFEEDPEEKLAELREEDNYSFGSYTPIEQPVIEEDESVEETHTETQKENNYIFESYTPTEQQVVAPDELDEETTEILDEKSESDPIRIENTLQPAESEIQTVTSFDELMAKYNIQPLEMVDETGMPLETGDPAKVDETAMHEAQPEIHLTAVETPPKNTRVQETDPNETVGEIVNEYGVFEESVVKKTDHDLDQDAFDRPLDQIPFVSEKIDVDPDMVADPSMVDKTEYEAGHEISATNDQVLDAVEINTGGDTGTAVNPDLNDSEESMDSPDKTDEHDYDAFDKPQEDLVKADKEIVNEHKIPVEVTDTDPDNTGVPDEYSDQPGNGLGDHMPEMSERFEEQQKVLSTFNAKNADSIVFTPYHMVDYFASQGIKLVLEDNPPDQFGKQLKSFTDWLKVMKKLPVQTGSAKDDDKEAEQIRHHAAHSIEERDVLTEAMAEVLAKQGMFENAIALYQKLSLIYPPKSAYFASRIVELKASSS